MSEKKLMLQVDGGKVAAYVDAYDAAAARRLASNRGDMREMNRALQDEDRAAFELASHVSLLFKAAREQ